MRLVCILRNRTGKVETLVNNRSAHVRARTARSTRSAEYEVKTRCHISFATEFSIINYNVKITLTEYQRFTFN